MELRFVSTFTSEDEERFASALLVAAGTLLDVFSIAYTLKIETSGAKVFQRSRPISDTAVPGISNRTGSFLSD